MTFYFVQQIVAEHPICTKQCARNEVGVGTEKSNKYESEVSLLGCYENIFVKVEG